MKQNSLNNDLIKIFLSQEGAGRRYALGRNEHSEELSKAIELAGFIDDFAPENSIWQGKPVIKRTQVPANAIVVNCVMSISPVTAAKNLVAAGIESVLSLSDLCGAMPDRLKSPTFVEKTNIDYRLNKNKWDEIFENLADIESKKVLNNVLQYRLTGDYRIMSEYSVRFKEQYFEDFLNIDENEVFVDCGGFDGDTTEEFCKRYPNYKKVYFFEPLYENLQKAKLRLENNKSIEFIEMGVSDKDEVLKFSSSGSASSVNESGDFEIQVTTIDKYINEKITFIKMDLEGWELNALEGCKNHISNDHPKLAIAVYHSASDFWRVFEFVRNIRTDYDIYIRHYTEGWSETVMFFIPKK